MPCTEGTVCAPVGMTYDFQTLRADADADGADSSSSAAMPTAYGVSLAGGAALMGVHGGLGLAVLFVHCGIVLSW